MIRKGLNLPKQLARDITENTVQSSISLQTPLIKQSHKLIIQTCYCLIVRPIPAMSASLTDYLPSHSVIVVGAQFIQVQPLVYTDKQKKKTEHIKGVNKHKSFS